MSSLRLPGIVMLTVLALPLLPGVACYPSSGKEEPPPLLELETEALTFGWDTEARSLLVCNAGGRTLSFEVQVSAQNEGTVWLVVEPERGLLSAGSSMALLVRVQGRDRLRPGQYLGEIVVHAERAGSERVQVSMEVGQPVLALQRGVIGCVPHDPLLGLLATRTATLIAFLRPAPDQGQPRRRTV